MADAWYAILALLLGAYVVLDGFDLGAGAIHRFVARTDEERRSVLASIGPFWDGNEVFLLAAGGALFVAFSSVLAVALSGLYLAVIVVLWTMLLRGISIELRSHLRDGVWRAFWDTVFQLSSGGLALLLGVALGNVLRGFPLEADGYFELELFSLSSPAQARGVVDGYTLTVGVLGLLVLAAHGARFVAMRTEGAVRDRATRLANRVMVPIALGWAAVTALTWRYAPADIAEVRLRPLAVVLLVAALVAFFLGWRWSRSGRLQAAFVASCVFLLSLLGLAATTTYPVLLGSTNQAVASMTIANSANPGPSLAAGLHWWWLAALLVAAYFANLFRIHRGRATAYGEGGDEPTQGGGA
jgi:cytochrome d ubiquinol oxidase subunit II